MSKTLIGLLVVAAMCGAEPAHYRAGRVRFLARQESAAPAAPAPTGYPAAGVTPEVPFDLPTATAKPDVTYLPPDNAYGPPPADAAAPEQQPDAVYGPPDSTYGPPPTADATEAPVIDEQPEAAPQPALQNQPTDVVVETEAEQEEEGEEILVAVDDDGAVIAVSNAFDEGAVGVTVERQQPAAVPARLVFQRFPQRRDAPASGPVPARIIQMRRVAPSKLRLMAQPQPQSFRYTSRFEQW